MRRVRVERGTSQREKQMRDVIERNILVHVTGKKASVAMAWGTKGKVT